MSVHRLLLRGMFAGLLAGLAAFILGKIIGEPQIDHAIAFETAQILAKGEAPEPELVSRAVQASLGLLTAMIVYGAALGGLFALTFAVCFGRYGAVSIRSFSALLAALCFVVVFAIPFLKYPANPPAVGDEATIGIRTALYFSMIAVSGVALVASLSFARLVRPRLGRWNAGAAAVVVFLVLVAVAATCLPAVDEVPGGFPAATLWRFRLASLGLQALLWAVIGSLFGILTQRAVDARG